MENASRSTLAVHSRPKAEIIDKYGLLLHRPKPAKFIIPSQPKDALTSQSAPLVDEAYLRSCEQSFLNLILPRLFSLDGPGEAMRWEVSVLSEAHSEAYKRFVLSSLATYDLINYLDVNFWIEQKYLDQRPRLQCEVHRKS